MNWYVGCCVACVISVGVCISRSGEASSPRRDWQRRKTLLLRELLAQATRDGVSDRHFRLREVVKKFARVERNFSSRQGIFGVLGDRHSRLGELA